MRKIIALVVLSFIFIQCNRNEDSLISKNQVGKLNNKTQIEDLDILFKNDSVVELPKDMDVIREYKIHETGGDHILTIRPNFEIDSLNLIESVQIFSDRFISRPIVDATF